MEERSAYQSVGFTYSDDAPKEESALDKSGSVTKGGAEDKFIPSESVPESIALVWDIVLLTVVTYACY